MKCPYCNYNNTEHEALDGQTNYKYKDSDLSFCINCGEVGIYIGNNVIKVNRRTLPKEHQIELQDLRMAWLKSRAIFKCKMTKQHPNYCEQCGSVHDVREVEFDLSKKIFEAMKVIEVHDVKEFIKKRMEDLRAVIIGSMTPVEAFDRLMVEAGEKLR